ncbi:MAG: DUF4339 domain-containing protein [Myxococcales bacterium]
MRWYLSRQGKTKGPYEKDKIIEAISAGHIALDDTLCQEGTEDWIPVRDLGAFAAAAPPPVVEPATVAPSNPGPPVQATRREPDRAAGAGVVWIDRGEKIARLLLWLTLAAATLIVPIEYIKQRRFEADVRDSVRREDAARAQREKAAAEAAKAQAEKSIRMSLSGPELMLLDGSTGRLWFTNVSSRAGVICVVGIATNPTTKASAESLPACKAITAYATNVEIAVMFAGGELRAVCQGVACSLRFQDVPDRG